jgi:hypothetical protein
MRSRHTWIRLVATRNHTQAICQHLVRVSRRRAWANAVHGENVAYQTKSRAAASNALPKV